VRAENTRKRRLRAFRRLVVKIAAGDAINERFLFLAVGEFQIGREISRHREGLRFRFVFAGVRGACHASSPQIPSAPVYGDCETPFVPKKRSVTSHQPLANCVELNVTSTLSG